MEAAKKDTEQFLALEESLEKAKAQTQMYSEAMENLQTEYEGLEQENIQLKKAAAAQKEDKRLSMPRKPSAFEGNSVVEEDTVTLGDLSDAAEYADMHHHMEILKAGIRYLRAENAHLKGCDLARSLKLEQLPAVVQPTSSIRRSTSEEDQEKEEEDHQDDDNIETSHEEENNQPEPRDMIRSLATETRVLLKDLRTATASPKVIALNECGATGEWRSMKKTPNYQYQTQQSVLYTLKQRSEQLKDKLKQLQYTTSPMTNNDDTMVHGAIQRPLNYLTQSIAQVKIPRLSNTTNTNSSSRHCIQLTSAAEFERIHSIFIR
ncbi:hypothetical protein BDA99DRAFT_123585 [Phascolomyces articulosus]|uniref:Uncharacterized protein n=1 Tax=Phascolomyces articulosus TaxID=60185 RepID=A0AAD5PIP5_9FUNG|nr:hypothetical protein BDA99DRAFT_123585 [Phascolomyces articulosus]